MKTIIKDVQGFVASLFPSIHRVAAPSHRRLQLSLITLLLTLGVGQMWGYTTYYLKSDNTTWDKSDNRWGFNNDGTTTTYMAKNAKLKLWRTDWGEDGWFGVGDTDGGNTLKAGDEGLQFIQYKQNVKYNGPSGMVCFHMDQTNNPNDAPWVWITRPTFYLKHNWGGGSWTWQTLTDNEDGTYKLTNTYGGTSLNYGDNSSDGGSGWGEITASVTGSPVSGDRCLFVFDASDKSATITKLCKITYDGNGKTSGTVPSAQSDNLYNASVTLSSNNLTKTGYSHTGWNTEADGNGTHYNKGASITVTEANLTLYAEWTPTKTVITLNKNAQGGSTVSGAASVTAIYDAALPSFTALSSTNDYALTGYWTDASGGTKIINANGTLVPNVTISTTPYTGADGIWKYTSSTLTLHAQWSLDRTLTYDDNGATSGSVPAAATSYANGTNVTVLGKNTLAKTGYTFNGWNTAADGKGTAYAADASITMNANYTLFAQWLENKSSVTIAASPSGTGTFSPASPVLAGVDTKPSVTATAVPGYKFSSWAITGGASISSTNTNPTTITGGGEGTAATLTATFARTYAFIEGRFHVTNSSRNGTWTNTFTTGDWNESSTNIPFDYDDTNHRFYKHTYATPKELTTQISSLNPVFYIKTSTSSSSLANVVSYWSSSSTTITTAGTGGKKALVHTGNVVNNNLRFNSSDESGYAIIYFDEAGVWYELEHTLNYNANTGTGSAPASETYYNHGVNATAASNTYSKTGYTFAGWNTQANGSGTSYAAGASVPMNSNITLYAQWNETTYAVTINDGDHGTVSPNGSQNIGAGGMNITATPSTGYYLTSWSQTGSVTLSSTTANTTKVTATGTGSVTPNYDLRWALLGSSKDNDNVLNGMPGWGTASPSVLFDNISGNIATCTVTLKANSDYKFKVYDRQTPAAMHGQTSTSYIPDATEWTLNGETDVYLYSTVAGNYIFRIDISGSNPKLTVTYPTIPAMSGTLSFNSSQEGKVCGLGTNESPFLVFQGNTLTLQATHNSAPETATEHIYYQYTVNSVAQTAKQGDRTFAPNTSSTTNNIPFTVQAFYQYGPDGHKVQGTPVTSTTYYYKVIPRPTVTISSITSQVEVGKNFTFDIATTNTDVSCLSGNGPWFTRQYRVWNGSDWGAWTDADADPITNASTLAMANEGFYQWQIKMNYGGATSAGGSEFYSTPVQNVIYKPCQVTITTSGSAVGWFKGVYAYREPDSFESLCSHHNGTYPGEYFKKSCVEADDNTWIYIFKYPIYTHIILNDNSTSTTNRTTAIPITQKTCIEITGQKESGTHDNNWAFTETENCGYVYYRVQTTYTPNSKTYYSNIVPQGPEAQLSFFAAKKGSGVLTFQKLDNGRWIDKLILNSPPQSGIYNATYNGSDGIKDNAITENNDPLYIRTDAAAGGWNNYTNKDNIMNPFTPRSNYDYYWVTYTGDGRTINIDAEIGNSINKCLAQRIEDRNLYADANGCVYEKNVRFSYDSQTNWFDYAVIGASTNNSYTFLSTYGADASGETLSSRVYKLTNTSTRGTATKENDPSNQVKFSDLSNWVYQADVWAEADGSNAVTIAIEARLPGIATVQRIVDRAQPLTTLGATTTAGSYIIRILYDYKTNTITTGWLPKNGENITGDKTIAGNMILNRGETTSVEQLSIESGKKVSGLQKIYMALKLDKSDLENGESIGEGQYVHYIWFSLPYDCKVSDIFGAPGEYRNDWEIWEYDGAERARKGLLDDASFFKTVPFNDGILQANTGYCLGLLLNENRFKTIVMDDVERSSIYIYFPSQEDGYTLQNSTNDNKHLDVLAHYDTDFFTRRPDRVKYDRDWNLVGVPSYNDITSVNSATDPGVEHTHEEASAPGFIYDYAYIGGTAGSSENNKYKYKAVNATTYKAFFSYMMQYAGTITWSSNSIENIKAAPAPRKPVRTGEHQLTQATLNLQLLANDEWLDNTFVSLLPKATDKVDHNIDLVKIWNSGSSQLCSLAEDVELAANCLSVDSQTVDLRVYIDNTRTYTFRLEEKVPDGLIALLEDTEAHTFTDLGSDAYTVDLMQGTYDGRFRLHLIVGSSDIGTDIDQLTNSMSYTLYGNELLLNALTEPVRAALYDPAGRLLYQGTVNPGNTINLPDQAGVYLLRLPTQTLRIVK